MRHVAEDFKLPARREFLMQRHESLTPAVPSSARREHIPQLKAMTDSHLQIEDGHAIAADTARLGIRWRLDEILRRAPAPTTLSPEPGTCR